MSRLEPLAKDRAVEPLLKPPKPVIEAEPSSFRQQFNHSPFVFSHHLTGHPLFEIPRLAQLANTLLSQGGPGKVLCQSGHFPVHRKWSDRPVIEQVTAAIAHIQDSNAWVLLDSMQLDPEYDALLNQIVIELEELTGEPLREKMTWLEGTIFISSPGSVTPYHIDHSSNFLLQIQGEKQVNLFDQRDRSVLTELEIEHYYSGDLEAATYRTQNQSKASVYALTPGKGVHHPVLAPHWVKTGHLFSVSLSVNFCLRSFDSQARIYQANHCLRQLGQKPTPPGQSALRDQIKIWTLGLFSERQPVSKYEVIRSGISRLKMPIKAVKQIVMWLKQSLSRIVTAIPIASDCYYYYWYFPRCLTACRGVFSTFNGALQAIPVNSRVGFNHSEIHLRPVEQLTTGRKLGEFDPRDYPVLVWLNSAFKHSSTLFDLGGNTGGSYYAYRNYLRYPDDLSWVVCDVPAVSQAGEELARNTNSPGLSFTVDFMEAEGADILLTCGTLQYLEASLAELLGQLHTKPLYLLINRVPFYDAKSFVTVQNIGYAFTPYKIQNYSEFIASLTSLGYELIDTWHDRRTCSIPFHPKRFVRAYHGFYFHLSQGRTAKR
jgi:putative methyltransferase (TIGR04325 family)